MITTSLRTQLSSAFYKNQFTGIFIIDAKSKDTVYALNSDTYFTPASNTKIFTLYTAMTLLPKRLPALQYIVHNDTLFFQGTGDPSFLHPYLKDSTAFNFLNTQNHLVYVTGNFQDKKYGPGWAWDDYEWYYSPERSGLPMYGNVVLAHNNPSFKIQPTYFTDSVLPILHKNQRDEARNVFYHPPEKDTLETPYITSIKTSTALLSTLLNKPIPTQAAMPIGAMHTLYGPEADSLYVRMMHESDNFIAEQLLLVCAGVLKDTLNSEVARTYMLEGILGDLAQMPRWVDGSGLSRYNLFTPQNMVTVLDKLHSELSTERLFSIFPEVKPANKVYLDAVSDEKPFLYAKSGSLSNNYCLSGYLLTKSGKTLLFSIMNNHFRNSTAEQRQKIMEMLETLRNTY